MHPRGQVACHYPDRVIRAVARALALSFLAEGLALVSGRIPWIAGLVVLASLSYLVEAVDAWRQDRRPAPVPAPVVPDAATSFALPSASGARSLSALQQPSRSRDAA